MSQLVKVGGAQAEGTRLARRVKVAGEQRESALARIEAEYRQRIKLALDEEEEAEGRAVVKAAVATSEPATAPSAREEQPDVIAPATT